MRNTTQILPLKVLYVEDDLIDQMLFKRLVRRMDNIECEIVSSLEEALDIGHQFDILITDYHLNGDTAFDVLEAFPNTSILVVSGFDDKKQLNKLEELGAIGHIPKPISKTDLENALLLEPISSSDQNEYLDEKDDTISISDEIQFDYRYLNKITRNSERVRQEMLQIFVNFIPSELTQLQTYFQNENWKQVGLSMHKIKSNMRLLGLHNLLAISTKIESKARYQTDINYIKTHTPFVIKSMYKAIELAKDLIRNE